MPIFFFFCTLRFNLKLVIIQSILILEPWKKSLKPNLALKIHVTIKKKFNLYCTHAACGRRKCLKCENNQKTCISVFPI